MFMGYLANLIRYCRIVLFNKYFMKGYICYVKIKILYGSGDFIFVNAYRLRG